MAYPNVLMVNDAAIFKLMQRAANSWAPWCAFTRKTGRSLM